MELWNAKVDLQGNDLRFQLPKPAAKRLGLDSDITQGSTKCGKIGDHPVVIEFIDESAPIKGQYEG